METAFIPLTDKYILNTHMLPGAVVKNPMTKYGYSGLILPSPRKYTGDYVNLLDDKEYEELEEWIKQFELD